MSWLMENWFGSKSNLEEIKEELGNHLRKETYLGISGIENPEQSSTRLSAKELFLSLYGPWGDKLETMDAEFLQFIHDELPPVVRDEVGVIPFYTSVVTDGILVLAFIRNASRRDIAFYKLPLTLVTPQGEVVARRTFNMLKFGSVGSKTSRPCEFLFRWRDFVKIPEQDVPLSLVFDAAVQKVKPRQMRQTQVLTSDELSRYQQLAAEQPPVPEGEVEIKVLDLTSADEGGLRVVVQFRNGLDKRLEFTEVPILIHDDSGDEVARVRFGLKNLHVDPHGDRIWGFHVPPGSIKKSDVDPAACTVFIPRAEPKKSRKVSGKSKGMIQ